MKDKVKIVTIVCLSGVILLLISLLVLRIIETNPKTQEQLQIKYVYNDLTSKYSKDKENSTVTDGKYSSTNIYNDGKELKYLGEFDIKSGKLIHVCISDGSKKLDVKYDDITNSYLKQSAKFERSIEVCKFD